MTATRSMILLYALVWISAVAIGQEASRPASANRSDLLLELLLEDSPKDTSENKHACCAHGNIEFVEGRGSGCASFDGKSWIDTGLLQKDLGSEFTVECWVIKPADYLAEVWLNGTRVGGHEGSETPFVLDVTDCVQLRQKNLLAVRRSKVEESWL